MSEIKKARRIALILGLVMLLGAALSFVLAARIVRYPAEITAVTDTYRSRRLNKSGGMDYNERVTVSFTGKGGAAKAASNVRVKRSTESQLPAVGDTIQVTDGIFGVREFQMTTYTAVGLALIFCGIVAIITGLRYGRKKRGEPS